MSEPSATVRTFICLDISTATRSALSRIQDYLRHEGLPLAFVNPPDAHITLVFLGSTAVDMVEAIKQGMERVVRSFDSFNLKLGGAGFFGSSRAPSVVWIGVEESNPLMDLQGKLAALAAQEGAVLEDRSFHPHLTVARIRKTLPPHALTLIKSSINNTTFGVVPVDRVLLMSSQPNGPGPRYKILHETPLKGTLHHA